MGDHSNEPLNSMMLRKSNDFIAAKYNASLLENKIISIALTRIEADAYDTDAPLKARLYPGELKRLVSDENHIYRDLAALAKTITGHNMFLEDGRGNFKSFSIVPEAEYVDGVLTISFSSQLRPHVLGLSSGYTTFELSVMTDFDKNPSLRIYELLKKEAYRIPKTEGACIQVEYGLSELKFMLGLANSEEQSVKNAFAKMGKNVDWDTLYDMLDNRNKKYEDWRDFSKRVLKPALLELEQKSDIRFTYEGIKLGRKINRVLFTIYRNQPENMDTIRKKKAVLDSSPFNRQLTIPEDLYPALFTEFVGHNDLTAEDLNLMLRHADMDEQIVRKWIKKADEQRNLRNYVGWIISAIDNNYIQTETLYGSADTARKVNSFIEKAETGRNTRIVSAWEKIKQKPEFVRFLTDYENDGLSLSTLESIYSLKELINMYSEWANGQITVLTD